MRRTILVGSCLALTVAAVACQDQTTSPVPAPARAAAGLRSNSTIPGGVSLAGARLTLPAPGLVVDQYDNDLARRAIDPSDYVCSESTPVIDWYIGEVNKIIAQEPGVFNLLYVNLLADLIPTYEAVYFETTATPQYFGYRGEFTKTLLKTERDVKGFWDIHSSDIQLVAMHGTVLLDEQKTAATYQVVFGLSPATAATIASIVHQAVATSQTLNGGNHPLFSFNSFAFTTNGGPIPDKIVMGDGILAGYAALGFGDVAPQAVFAHEFAHHIQFENNYFNDVYATAGTAPERTRYTELMADAFSAYFLTHKRGGAMNRKRVEQFLEVFFEIGDCAFTDSGHHGTPNQRMAAARFGFDVADQAQVQGRILTSAEFHALFVAQYPTLIAPDAH